MGRSGTIDYGHIRLFEIEDACESKLTYSPWPPGSTIDLCSSIQICRSQRQSSDRNHVYLELQSPWKRLDRDAADVALVSRRTNTLYLYSTCSSTMRHHLVTSGLLWPALFVCHRSKLAAVEINLLPGPVRVFEASDSVPVDMMNNSKCSESAIRMS